MGQKGRSNRSVGRGAGGGSKPLNFRENDSIATFATLLDRANAREGLAEWVETLIPEKVDEVVTSLIDPATEDSGLFKFDVTVGGQLDPNSDKLPTCIANQKLTALATTFIQVVLGYLEQFYQKLEPEAPLRGKSLQLVLHCQLIQASSAEPDHVHRTNFTVQGNPGDQIVVTSQYLLKTKDLKLRLGFQNLTEPEKPDLFFDMEQDSLIIWRNDMHTNQIEATGNGTALLLSVGFVDPQSVFTS